MGIFSIFQLFHYLRSSSISFLNKLSIRSNLTKQYPITLIITACHLLCNYAITQIITSSIMFCVITQIITNLVMFCVTWITQNIALLCKLLLLLYNVGVGGKLILRRSFKNFLALSIYFISTFKLKPFWVDFSYVLTYAFHSMYNPEFLCVFILLVIL